MQDISLLFLVLMAQEPFTSTAAILAAYHNGVHSWSIHCTFVAATVLDIFIGYFIGIHVKDFHIVTKVSKYLSEKKEKYKKVMEKIPRRWALFILGPTFFPLTVPLLPVLGFSFYEIFFISLLGEIVLWYLPVLGVAYSLNNFLGEKYWKYGFVFLILLGVCFLLRKKRQSL